MEAVRQNGWALRYASKELKRDREVVMQAAREKALRRASKEV